MFEGVPTYPDAGRFWKMIQDHKVTRVLHGADRDPLADQGRAAICPKKYDLSSLRMLGIGRRADQSRSVDVVLQDRRRRRAARSSIRGGKPKPAAT